MEFEDFQIIFNSSLCRGVLVLFLSSSYAFLKEAITFLSFPLLNIQQFPRKLQEISDNIPKPAGCASSHFFAL